MIPHIRVAGLTRLNYTWNWDLRVGVCVDLVGSGRLGDWTLYVVLSESSSGSVSVNVWKTYGQQH